MSMATINANAIAREYREQWNKSGGVVVLFDLEVCRWVNELRNPEHWRPGVIAIDEAGNQWEARGHGGRADRWEQIVYAPEFSTASTTENQ